MPSYLEGNLGKNETLVARAHFSWAYSALAWAALLLLGIFVIGAVIFIVMMVRRWTTEIGVTSRRFVQKTGLFSLKTCEIALANIEKLTVHQSFAGKLLNYGRVTVEGAGKDAVTTPNIADPVGFISAIETAQKSA